MSALNYYFSFIWLQVSVPQSLVVEALTLGTIFFICKIQELEVIELDIVKVKIIDIHII